MIRREVDPSSSSTALLSGEELRAAPAEKRGLCVKRGVNVLRSVFKISKEWANEMGTNTPGP
jgi:hypothetical protein